jgi:ABC-2 type transport system permease protein
MRGSLMLRSVYLKALRDRWLGVVIGTAALGATVWMGVASYASVGNVAIDAFRALPKGFLDLMGLNLDLGILGMMFGEMTSAIGPFVLGGLLIAMGADAGAGEERWGTMGLLLANPRSRRRVMVEKSLAMITITALGSLLVWGGYWASVGIVGVDATGYHLGSTVIHLAALAFFLGALSMAIGAWTGDTTRAAGIGTAVMVVSFFGAGLLPLLSWGKPWAKIFPWYYLNGADPFLNGVAWGHVAVLAGLGIGCLALAMFGIERRDLKVGETRTTILGRLARNPRVARYAQKISGSAQVASIAAKSTSDARAALTIAGGGLFYMAAIIGPLFKGVGNRFGKLTDAFPPQLMAMVGNANYSTPAGFYTGEIFSMVAPVAVAVVAISMAAKALAGEERDRTMGVLLANPVTRSRVVLEKAGAMTAMTAVVGLSAFIGVVTGDLIARLGMSYVDMAAVCVHLTAFGVLMGAIALFAGALTGVSRVATAVGTGVTTLAYAAASFLPLSVRFHGWAKASPFYYYSGSSPLQNGFAWGHIAVLAGASAVFVALSVWAFNRRDLRG